MKKTYDYQCKDCEWDFIGLAEYEERDSPQECPACLSTNSKRVYRTANMSTRNSRAFIDGHGSRKREMDVLKTQSILEDAAHSADFGSDSMETQAELNRFKQLTKKTRE